MKPKTLTNPLGSGRSQKDWKPLNLKIDTGLWLYLNSLCSKKGDKTKVIETLIREHKAKNDVFSLMS